MGCFGVMALGRALDPSSMPKSKALTLQACNPPPEAPNLASDHPLSKYTCAVNSLILSQRDHAVWIVWVRLHPEPTELPPGMYKRQINWKRNGQIPWNCDSMVVIGACYRLRAREWKSNYVASYRPLRRGIF